jgi:phage FluMu gp28-like protein
MPAIPLYPYQRKWITTRPRFKVGMFARQSGKTFTSTLEIVDDCFEAESQGRRTHWVILSRGERQAKEAMQKGIIPHCKAYSMALSEIEGSFDGVRENGERFSYQMLEVVLPGGSRITALPANPDTARGFSANVLLDEFAYHQDSREIWRALFPVISAGFRLIVISTPNGKANKFYDLMTGDDHRWYRQTCDIYQAVADGLPRDIDELREGMNDEDGWKQEFELQWLDEASAWLSYDLISSVEDDKAGDPALYTGGPVYIGNDIARRKHLWVAWAWELVGDVLWCREISTLRNVTFATQDATLDEMVGRYRMLRLAMDQTGLGEKPVEDAKRRYGGTQVEGVLMTGPNKQMLATLAKEKFEDRQVRIPMGDRLLRADLHAIKKVTGETGLPRFVADDSGESHADRAWSAFLGIHAAGGPAVSYDCHRVPLRSRGPGDDRRGHDGRRDESRLIRARHGRLYGGRH